MKVRMRLPAGLEFVESEAILAPNGFIVQEMVYVYKKNPRIHYLAHTRYPANERVIDGMANPYFIARYIAVGDIGHARLQARERLLRALTAHYSRPESEWNVDVDGNALLSIPEPEQAEEQAEQGSWRDRPPML